MGCKRLQQLENYADLGIVNVPIQNKIRMTHIQPLRLHLTVQLPQLWG